MKEKRNRAEIVERCVELWEASVRVTHDFLVEGDIEFYRPFVRENCEKLPLLLHYEGDDIVAFLGYDMTSIEMLFVDPDYRGRGIGRDLIEWAIEDVHAERVAVNEQNVQAVGFYARMGFEVEHRTETDGCGKPYPILYLRLKYSPQRMVKVTGDKKTYLPLLLDADPCEAMIDRYLEESDMFVLEKDGKVIGEAVVDGKGEIKNLAVLPEYQGKLYGMYIISSLVDYYKNHFSRLWVGTSESGVGYYERYGFVRDHVVKNFFTNNYPEPIIDNGIPCVDMTYLYLEIR